MPKLLGWPEGLGITSLEPINAPAAVTGGSTETLGGFAQTVSGLGFLWQFSMTFAPMNKARARSHRGWLASQIGGANAVRFKIIDGDKQTKKELGLELFDGLDADGYEYGLPLIELTQAHSKGDTIVRLPDTLWGHRLGLGDWLGFGPLHLGAYRVTEEISAGEYRIYPPLRKDVAIDDVATLQPVVALRLASPDAGNEPRGVSVVEGATFVGIEVLEEHIREHYDVQS